MFTWGNAGLFVYVKFWGFSQKGLHNSVCDNKEEHMHWYMKKSSYILFVHERNGKKMNIFMIIFFLFEAVIGFASSLYMIVSLFVVIGYKIYRKCKFGYSLYD